MNQEIIALLKAALECSVYVSPCDPGLTLQELAEIGKRAGHLDGEIDDFLKFVGTAYFGRARMLPSDQDTRSWVFFFPEEPEYKNFHALDFVFDELNLLTRSEGAGKAMIERNVLVERAAAKAVPRHDVEVAITWLVLAKQLIEKDNVLRFAHPGVRALPSVQRDSISRGQAHRRPHRAKAYPFVKDLIERRTDGRPRYVEPLAAFADELEKLGYGPFRLWWMQTVSELRQTDPNSTPVAISVLAAAIVEGALTFIVKHGRESGRFQSKEYEREPRNWKIEDLVASAAFGGPSSILDLQAKTRAETLIKTRQRIHAGRMLSDYPKGPPDIRPDEARDAKGTADQVVRAVLDWLEKNPVGF